MKNQTKTKFAFLASPIWLTITYLFFVISNLIALFFNFEIGLKINAVVSIISDFFFITYLWTNRRKT
ncbi:hypothetical protein [Candidatus Phytoplasma sp. AldY-WA1]|uniref:hypothetical protein n=1 Tax=Candidatus Phytoplasma sp. AldY-WA1 TaxID=2852100 RepID=UPI0025518DAF|nr:hypothetical protein [Candidatus Phytoplasma sp. AldY-WA1]